MSQSSKVKREDFLYATGRVRILEKRLLPPRQMQLMLDASSWEEVIRLFRETHYGRGLGADATLADCERALAEERKRLYEEIHDVAPNSPLTELVTAQDRYHNLKVLLKTVFLGEDLSHLLVEVRDTDMFYRENLLRFPEKNPRESWEEKAVAAALEDYREHGDLQRSEFLMDRHMLMEMQELAQAIPSPLIQDWVREQVDFYQLNVFLRMGKGAEPLERFTLTLAEGGSYSKEEWLEFYQEGKFPLFEDNPRLNGLVTALQAGAGPALLEKARDEASIEWAREGQKVTYGPEVPFSYWLGREMELLDLRILLVSLSSQLPAEKRAQRLRKQPR